VVREHIVRQRRLGATRDDEEALRIRNRACDTREGHTITSGVGDTVWVIVAEHLIERASLAKKVHQEHRTRL
jgi:hypothetical protein